MTATRNSHKIRSQTNLQLLNGIPNHMFYFPEQYGGTQKAIKVNQDNAEGVIWRCSVKKVFLEILQNSRESTCARVSFLLKKRLCHKCFPVNFSKFVRTPFLMEHLWWLLRLLVITKYSQQVFT